MAIADCCIGLGLGQEQARGQIGSADVSVPEVRSQKICKPEIRLPQIRRNKISSSKIHARKVGPFQFGAHQIRILPVQFLFAFLEPLP